MTLSELQAKFNGVLTGLNSSPVVNFCSAVEAAYEALTLAHAIQEYARIFGGVHSITHPTSPSFLNQKPGKFRRERSFKVHFRDGSEFYFVTDIELFGLAASRSRKPLGMKFEADVVVIYEWAADEIIHLFNGYPTPDHIHSVYECKFGKFHKGQLRELLGLRRHISVLSGDEMQQAPPDPGALDGRRVINADPAVPVKMVRPTSPSFFDLETQTLFDLQQLLIK